MRASSRRANGGGDVPVHLDGERGGYSNILRHVGGAGSNYEWIICGAAVTVNNLVGVPLGVSRTSRISESR